MRRSIFNANVLLGTVFTIIGAVFTVIGILTGIFLPAIEASPNSHGDVWVLPVIFTTIGVIFLVVGVFFWVLYAHRRNAQQVLLDEGRYVMAEISNIRQNYCVSINGRHPYVIECEYVDPVNGTVHVFHSENVEYASATILGAQIPVYTDLQDFRNYFVDVEAVIGEVQIHG